MQDFIQVKQSAPSWAAAHSACLTSEQAVLKQAKHAIVFYQINISAACF